jgi:hypothetical protein
MWSGSGVVATSPRYPTNYEGLTYRFKPTGGHLYYVS